MKISKFLLCLSLLSVGEIYCRAYDVVAYRPTDPNKVVVKVSTSNEAVYVMEGDKPLMVAATCVGIPGHQTPLGKYSVTNKIPNKRSGEYGFWKNGNQIVPGVAGHAPGGGWQYIGYPMACWVEFAPGFGFHQGYVWPQPRTHGCLRLHASVAPKFYELVHVGTPVIIAQSLPEDATIGKNLKRPTDYLDKDPPAEYMTSPSVFNNSGKANLLPAKG